MNIFKNNLYLFALLEGAVVMAVELLTARMIAPYFGSSLYIWGAVIGVTFTSLAIGYYIGGVLADRYPRKNTLYWVMLLPALVIMVMPSIVEGLIMTFENSFSVFALITVCILALLPSLGFLGMVPTLLIRLQSEEIGKSGKITGNVYTISSLGGIMGIFLMGFWIIPKAGLTLPSFIIGILLGMAPFVLLIRQKKYMAMLFIVFLIIGLSAFKSKKVSADIEVLYYAEGLLGQVLVADMKAGHSKQPGTKDRLLFVNRMGQTVVNLKTRKSRWSYPDYVTAIASVLPEKSDALILGLGGGTIANRLNRALGLNVDAVEFDARILEVAKRYFGLSKAVNPIIDDARHYLETTDKKYDLIVSDVLIGEISPAHLFTVECFEKAKTLLKPGGLLVVVFSGFITGETGRAGRSLYKTLDAAGYKTHMLPTWEREAQRNMLFIASPEEKIFTSLRMLLPGNKGPVPLTSHYIDPKTLDFTDAITLTDDKPILAKLKFKAARAWRKKYIEVSTRLFSEKGVPLFE